MQEGQFRCDANVSVRRPGAALGTRCEIKNLNSFRFLEKAIEFEARRQIDLIEDGGKVVQETRLFDPDRGETRAMRTKEDAQDYRYFPDPDLLPVEIPEKWIAKVRAQMPALPHEKRTRYEKEYALAPYQALLLTESREKADFFERSLSATESISLASLVANWVNGEVSAIANRREVDFSRLPIRPDDVGEIVNLIHEGTISANVAKEVLLATADGEGTPSAIVERRGLRQISDTRALEAAVEAVVSAQAKLVGDYRAGKEKAFNALVGQVMKATQGKANPVQVSAILKRRLETSSS